jgi:hypothetical protein
MLAAVVVEMVQFLRLMVELLVLVEQAVAAMVQI